MHTACVWFMPLTIWIACVPGPGFVCGQSKEQVDHLIKNLTTDYNKLILPVTNQSQLMTVTLDMLLLSIDEFDEVFGTLNVMSQIFLSWTDESLQWDPLIYGGIDSLRLPYSDVWVPAPVLSNPTENTNAIGSTKKDWLTVGYSSTGAAKLSTMMVTKTACAANVQNYPFDEQTCDIIYSLANDVIDEVLFTSNQVKADTRAYEENSLWDLVDSNVSRQINGGTYAVKTTLKLKRRPTHVLLNTILPIFCLSLLKNLVFLLPADAGERVSYSITVLLSISVFMTIVNGSIPASSNPVSIFSIYLVFEFLLNMFTTAIVVINLRLHYSQADDKVPRKLNRLLATITSKVCKKASTQIRPTDLPQKPKNDQHPLEKIDMNHGDISETNETVQRAIPDKEVENNDETWTWKALAVEIDSVCFPIVSTLSIMFFLLFIAVTTIS